MTEAAIAPTRAQARRLMEYVAILVAYGHQPVERTTYYFGIYHNAAAS